MSGEVCRMQAQQPQLKQLTVGCAAVAAEAWFPPACCRREARHHFDHELEQVPDRIAGRCNLHVDDASNVPSAMLLREKELLGMTITMDEVGRLPGCGKCRLDRGESRSKIGCQFRGDACSIAVKRRKGIALGLLGRPQPMVPGVWTTRARYTTIHDIARALERDRMDLFDTGAGRFQQRRELVSIRVEQHGRERCAAKFSRHQEGSAKHILAIT